MNKRIRELAKTARGQMVVLTTVDDEQWRQHEEFVEKFAELILNDVMYICEDLGDKGQDGHYCVDAIRRKYFGVEELVTEPAELHTCPYAEEIHGDYETLCDCDKEATRQCAMDV